MRRKPAKRPIFLDGLEPRLLLSAAVDAAAIAPYFDEQYYDSHNPDVAAAIHAGTFQSGLQHFLTYGIFENRNPDAVIADVFIPSDYLSENPDVAAAINANTSPLVQSAMEHFLLFGMTEGRAVNALFDPAYYLQHNPDVAAGVQNKTVSSALAHFIEYGEKEGRSPTPVFDAAYYLASNPDVAQAVASGQISSAVQHYYSYGLNEGRIPSPLFTTEFFDSTYYLAHNAGVSFQIQQGTYASALVHYLKNGASEGYNPSPLFIPSYYVSTNPDLASVAGTNPGFIPLLHFLDFGMAEGRSPSPLFKPNVYVSDNPGVAAQIGSGAGQYATAFQQYLFVGQGQHLVASDVPFYTYVQLPGTGSAVTEAIDANASGLVLGLHINSVTVGGVTTSTPQALIYDASHQNLGWQLLANNVTPAAINDSGTVALNRSDGTAYLLNNGVTTEVPIPTGYTGIVITALSNNNMAAGYAYIGSASSNTNLRPQFIFANGVTTTFNAVPNASFPAPLAQPVAINDSGEVVGSIPVAATTTAAAYYKGYTYFSGTLTNFDAIVGLTQTGTVVTGGITNVNPFALTSQVISANSTANLAGNTLVPLPTNPITGPTIPQIQQVLLATDANENLKAVAYQEELMFGSGSWSIQKTQPVFVADSQAVVLSYITDNALSFSQSPALLDPMRISNGNGYITFNLSTGGTNGTVSQVAVSYLLIPTAP